MMSAKLLRLGRIDYRPLKMTSEHSHDFFHVCYVVGGQGIIILNGDIHVIGPSDIHFYHPSWIHDIVAQPHSDFKTIDLRFMIKDRHLFHLAKTMPAFLRAGIHAEQIASHLQQIETLGTRQDNPLWMETAHAHLTIILSIILQSTSSSRPMCPSNEYASTFKHLVGTASIPFEALKLMRESLPLGWRISELADELYVSPTHLTNIFKAHFGITPQEMMIKLKIDHAKHVLVTTPTRKITDIAQDYGWKDLRRFRTYFKDVTGMAPSTYTNQFQEHLNASRTHESWLVFDDSTRLKWRLAGQPPRSPHDLSHHLASI